MSVVRGGGGGGGIMARIYVYPCIVMKLMGEKAARRLKHAALLRKVGRVEITVANLTVPLAALFVNFR